MLSKHEDLFRPELGKAKTIEAKLHLEAQAMPRFCKGCPVPYDLREKVEKELSRLQEEEIIEPVQFSDMGCSDSPSAKTRQLSEDLWGLQTHSEYSGKGRSIPSAIPIFT